LWRAGHNRFGIARHTKQQYRVGQPLGSLLLSNISSKRTAPPPLNSSVRPLFNNMANRYLLAGAALSAVAALLHLACIFFGPSWYRFFGAGERMAQLSAAGRIGPAVVTTGIAGMLMLWAIYAASGAGVIPKLPLIRTALCAITGVYLLRGLSGFVLAFVAPSERSVAFWCWSSLFCLAIGTLYLVGTRQVWPELSRAAA
jgi:hypothetical protein